MPFAPNSAPRQQTTIGWVLAVVSLWAEGVRSPMCKAPDPIAVRAAMDRLRSHAGPAAAELSCLSNSHAATFSFKAGHPRAGPATAGLPSRRGNRRNRQERKGGHGPTLDGNKGTCARPRPSGVQKRGMADFALEISKAYPGNVRAA